MKLRSFVISRSTWHRGKGAAGSKLLVPDTGRMCCLGSIAKQCGATDEQILNITSPWALVTQANVKVPGFTDVLTCVDTYAEDDVVVHSTELADEMMQVNDNSSITDIEREAELQCLAAEIGWTLTFVD